MAQADVTDAEGKETTTDETEEHAEAQDGADDFKLDGEDAEEAESNASEAEDDDKDKGSEAAEEEEETGPIDVSIGDATPASPAEDEGPAPGWAKELRKKYREVSDENRRLKAERATPPQVEQAPVLVPKPKASDPDIDFDATKLEAKMAAHYESKAKVDKWQAEQKAKQDQQQAGIQKIRDEYTKEKEKLKARADDMDDAEDTIRNTFDETQQATIVQSLKKKAPLVILALHRDPKEAKRLAAIKDPLDLALALGGILEKVNVKSRHPTTRPAAPVRGGSATRPHLRSLEAKADKMTDLTELFAAQDAETAKKKK